MEGARSIAEAERWLAIAQKLLLARDLHGTRTFAIRARESYPRLEASEQVLAVVDILIAGESRINNHHDWYSVLQIIRFTTSIDTIANQYRRLALLLDPNRNKNPFSDEAFKLVHDAWSVLSNPSRKALYDNELKMADGLIGQNQRTPARKSPRFSDGGEVEEEERPTSVNNAAEPIRKTRVSESTQRTESTFWTACPYCYNLYEYQKVYEECTLKCQKCLRAFHAITIPAPPLTGKDTYFCSWGFFPLGISRNLKGGGGSSNWSPISPMFACPVQPDGGGSSGKRNYRNASNQRGPRVYLDDDEDYVEISDPSEDDSDDEEYSHPRKKKVSKAKGKASASKNVKKTAAERIHSKGNQSVTGDANLGNGEILSGGVVGQNAGVAETSRKAAWNGAKKRGAGNLGKLDLNVEFSNEVEEPAPGVEDNIEGIGFFEGLDEFLSSLPILNVVADDKGKGN